MTQESQYFPGKIALLGSGETSSSGGQVFEALARGLPDPLRVRVLETPAGFELNAGQVAARVADYLRVRLQNYHPDVQQVAARQRDPQLTIADPGVNAPLLDADLIFLGPGSPSYAVRVLRDSLTWELIRARHRRGAALAFASAAAIATGALALPVYEVYKVGEDPHWKPGLDLFAPFGLSLVIVPHWNNQDGGAELDTSRCFFGRERFDPLAAALPEALMIVGLDEQTGLVMDMQEGTARVIGRDGVHLVRAGQESYYARGAVFSLRELGNFSLPQSSSEGVDPLVWAAVQNVPAAQTIPAAVLELAGLRQQARQARAWNVSDDLRRQIAAYGYRVQDTPEGQKLEEDPSLLSD